jgi:hypothetical protein
LWPPPITMTSGIRFGYLSVKNAASANPGETPSQLSSTATPAELRSATYEVRSRNAL